MLQFGQRFLESFEIDLQFAGMELFEKDFGGKGNGNPPLVLLHGLLGSSRNWVTVSRLLTPSFHVFALDLRNHGNSFHDDVIDYPTMAEDVLTWMNKAKLDSIHICGHSMGGKVAMWLACNYPDRIRSLTIADIAPKDYSPHFRVAFDGMHQVDPSGYQRISEVEQALAAFIDEPVLRQFLVTNLRRNEQGTFNWQVNLKGLTDALPELSMNPIKEQMQYPGKTLLLYGETSDFVEPSDLPTIKSHFPNCTFSEVPNSGHNVHVENRHFFAEQLIANQLNDE